MLALAGPYFMFATLLVVSGLPKLTRPGATARAMYAVGLPATMLTGRLVGVAEIAVGVAALAWGGPLAAVAVAVLYSSFAAFIVAALRSESARSCGCFGKDNAPPSRLHLIIDLAAAATAAVLVFRPLGHVGEVMQATPWEGMPLLLLVLIGTWLARLVLTLLPGLSTQLRTLERA